MRILLAEDEPSLSRALQAILQKADYEVDLVHDGESALDCARCGGYGAIVLDVMMPQRDGFEVLREIRRAGLGTPILMLTARSSIEDRVEGLDSGANDYLVKPFAAKELLARIRAMTRSASALDATTLRVGNVTLDCAACALRGPKGIEPLPNREFQLMELLMENRGEHLSTARLLEEVWGADAPEDVNVVWVYLSYLRKRLVSVGADVAIKSVRNRGYALEEVKR